MRSLFGSLATLLMMLVIGCTWVDADECWPNTSGGFGGGGTIPIGAGVGASGSGDYITEPPKGPLDKSGTPNPCVTPENPPHGGVTVARFSPSEFPFVATTQDDGQGKGGGYQEARVNLEFKHYVIPSGVAK